jgi:nitrogen fixation protein NifZ
MNGIEPRAPIYAWGQRVIALDDLVNDGSYPERPADALLVERGVVGEIVNIGHAVEENEPVYLVEFPGCVVGCLEDEIVPAPKGLLPETDEAPEQPA